MARKRLTVQSDFDPVNATSAYIELKAQEKDITDRTKSLNKQIKEYLESNEKSIIESDAGSVTLTYREKDVFDEAGMIEKFRGTDIVKTKEYIDYDALESALYHETIDSNEVIPFKSVKKTAVLNIKKAR